MQHDRKANERCAGAPIEEVQKIASVLLFWGEGAKLFLSLGERNT